MLIARSVQPHAKTHAPSLDVGKKRFVCCFPSIGPLHRARRYGIDAAASRDNPLVKSRGQFVTNQCAFITGSVECGRPASFPVTCPLPVKVVAEANIKRLPASSRQRAPGLPLEFKLRCERSCLARGR